MATEVTRRRLLRAAIVGLPVAVFAFLRPGPFVSALGSPTALIRIGLLTVALVGVSRLVRRFVPNPMVQTAVPALLGIAVLGLVVAPYFQRRDGGRDPAHECGGTGGGRPGGGRDNSGIDFAADGHPGTRRACGAATTLPAGPARITAGTLRGIDHRASGAAAVYKLADGTAFVRLEDIDIQNGPDYVVYLVPGADRRSPGAGVDLGELKGNQGTQNYVLPAGFDISGPQTVLIWCRAFTVPVAHASQLPTS